MTGMDFDGFVREHERMVRALAYSYVRDDHAADDVMQEAFLRAFKSFDGMREPAYAKTWLYALTRNAAIDHLRSRRRKPLSLDAGAMEIQAPAPRETGDDVERVVKAVDGLREDYRQIILLRYVDKLSYRKIAEILHLSVGAVGEKLHRVRNMISEMV